MEKIQGTISVWNVMWIDSYKFKGNIGKDTCTVSARIDNLYMVRLEKKRIFTFGELWFAFI